MSAILYTVIFYQQQFFTCLRECNIIHMDITITATIQNRIIVFFQAKGVPQKLKYGSISPVSVCRGILKNCVK